MADIKKGWQIPYGVLAENLFPTTPSARQKLIPFLGAGVSISGKNFSRGPSLVPPPPNRTLIDETIDRLQLNGRGKTFMEMAILLAYLVQITEAATPIETEAQVLSRLSNDSFPPSASELAELFSLRSHYTTFFRICESLRELFPAELFTAGQDEQIKTLQLLAKATRIASPPDPLTSISSYFEKSLGRQELWELLHDIFSKKQQQTRTHDLLADAAQHHLRYSGARDYLIITTNYDCLMEKALDDREVPYVVLTVKKGNDPKVLIRCSQTVVDRDELIKDYHDQLYPNKFTFLKARSLVVIYKIHGCLYQGIEYKDEGVVISDNDYVDYISQMSRNDGIIPLHVSELMREKPFWFLGYSLSDWNVRSIYEAVKGKSNPDKKEIKDFSVMYSVGKFEELFFEKNNITIFQASLNEFVDGIRSNMPGAA